MYNPTSLAKFVHKSNLDSKYALKGYESHPNEIEAPGYFTELDSQDLVTINKTAIPDCYELASPNTGYLRVPDMKTSFYLRTKGDTFKCKCKNNGDGSWTVLENIPPIK